MWTQQLEHIRQKKQATILRRMCPETGLIDVEHYITHITLIDSPLTAHWITALCSFTSPCFIEKRIPCDHAAVAPKVNYGMK